MDTVVEADGDKFPLASKDSPESSSIKEEGSDITVSLWSKPSSNKGMYSKESPVLDGASLLSEVISECRNPIPAKFW